jgi:uncharacterized protein (DUF58 family)
MLPAEIYSQVKRLAIETNHIVNTTFAGEYHSAFRGLGVEFEEVRPYIEGDDVRFIDWNVTAKMNQPYVKIFREERELSIFLLVDRSASMQFGSVSETKKALLLKLTALLALVSMKNNDRVGLVIFTDQIEKVILPKKGRRHVLRIIEEVLVFNPTRKQTNLACPLEFIAKLALKKSVLFILSDFKSPDFAAPLEIVARKHDVVPIILSDPLERNLSGSGWLRLEDLENQRVVIANLRDPKLHAHFQQKAAAQRQQLRQYFRRQAIDFIELQTEQPYLGPLVNYFQRRIRRRRY